MMKKINTTPLKTEHAPDCTCSICGLNYKGFTFKKGYVCESCLNYIRDSCNDNDSAAGASQIP